VGQRYAASGNCNSAFIRMDTMNPHPFPCGTPRTYRWALLCLFVFFALAMAAVPAQASTPGRTAQTEAVAVDGSPALPGSGLVLGSLFTPIKTLLSNRSHMIQMATIGMCIALFIMMRK
jgi:hypothetical protein